MLSTHSTSTNSFRRWPARAGAAATLALCLLASGSSLAQAPTGSTKQQADAAFDEGREFFEQGRFKDACDKFELSMQLDPSPGTLLNLGNCYEPQGDLLRALATFEQALSDAAHVTDRKRKQVWSDAAKARIASLSGRIPELTVEGAEPGSTLLLDGKPLEHQGQAQHQNPGRHQLELSAEGKRTYTKVFELPEGQRMGIHLPPLERDAPKPVEVALAPATALTAPAPEPRPSQHEFGIWPIVAGGTGAALLGTSLITGLMASSKAKRLQRECDGKACDPALESVKNTAHTLGVTTDVLWISGAVFLGTGVTLFLLDRHGAPEETAVQAGCFEGGCGMLANGRF